MDNKIWALLLFILILILVFILSLFATHLFNNKVKNIKYYGGDEEEDKIKEFLERSKKFFDKNPNIGGFGHVLPIPSNQINNWTNVLIDDFPKKEIKGYNNQIVHVKLNNKKLFNFIKYTHPIYNKDIIKLLSSFINLVNSQASNTTKLGVLKSIYQDNQIDDIENNKQIHFCKSIKWCDADLILLMDVLEHVDDDVGLSVIDILKADPSLIP
jgi:hypothetical protein